MAHHIAEDYYTLPLVEYARGACEAALADDETAAHVILFPTTSYYKGGLYLAFKKVPSGVDPEEYVKVNAHGYLKVVDLSEDIDEQLENIDEVHTKVTGHKFQQANPYG